MSLVDIPSPTAEDQFMDPAIKQYVDNSLAVSDARFDTKLAEFRAVMEAYTARAEEREIAAGERASNLERRMDNLERRMDKLDATIGSLKRFVIGASLSTVLGVGAFNAALIQNYHAAFDSARVLTAAQQDAVWQRQRLETALTALEARLAAMNKHDGQGASPR